MRKNINFNHLECFLVVAKHLSFSKASQVLQVAQPAISKHIKLLEESLSTELFLRSNKNVILTEAGSDLYHRVSKAFYSIHDQCEEFINHTGTLRGEIRMGSLSEIGETHFVPLLSQFKKLHPDLRINLVYLKSEEIIELMKKGELDFGIIATPIFAEGFRSYVVVVEDIILATNPKNYTENPNVQEIGYVAHSEEDPLVHQSVQQHLPKSRTANIKIEFTVNSHQSMIPILKEHPFFAVLPKHSVLKQLEKGELVEIPNKGWSSELYLVHRDMNFPDRKIIELKNFLMPKKRAPEGAPEGN